MLGNKFHIDSRWNWYHNDPEINMQILENGLYFQYCDYRSIKPHKRKANNKEYIIKEKIAAADPKLEKKFGVYQGVNVNRPSTELSIGVPYVHNVGCNIIEN